MATRRLRGFKRWMKANGVDCSDALNLVDDENDGVSVRASCDLKEGDVVANISKPACLTIKTSGAREIIESAGLDGSLGLSVALMYERSLGEESPWSGYLQILPVQEDLPLVWSLEDLDSLLSGTELHKVVKEDHVLICEDWEENISPLTSSLPQNVDPDSFGIKEYLAAKSLIASRSFQIDDYHGSGMVPLADLFNHKTGAEDVHFTADSSHSESDTEADESDNGDAVNEATDEDEPSSKSSSSPEQFLEEVPGENTDNEAEEEEEEDEEEEENSSMLQDDLSGLKMIMVKDVAAGAEVFNTYGLMGNATLLHRYGFTEPDNPYDIVNIDLELVTEWSSSSFTSRYTRSRLALWRKLGCAGCESQNSEYFEVSSTGEPQTELLILLYILLLPDDAYNKLDLAISTKASLSKEGKGSSSPSSPYVLTIGKHKFKLGESENDVLLTDGVSEALLTIVDKRESLYGSLTSFEDDIAGLKACCLPKDRRLYHSLVLRVSERKILKQLRSYIRTKANELSGGKRRKKMVSKS
ncbi:PREDICTED: ribosomal lysine N-methyltransferase 3-like isoform X2 [Camelina sativa]|uniref:N-lysine methyltransferase n=1 Tax=Camelina sativa TaxID=90675 RepID=A0ABM0ZIN0_CAMSA|nr:PREDICTED: ribosomal lysine N-methyltransferase 3-like isoform X2 [Camelina sativa]